MLLRSSFFSSCWLALLLIVAPAAFAQDPLDFKQLAATNPFYSGAPDYPRWSPFASTRWQGNQPIVKFRGKWYFPESIHGVTYDEIVTKCDKENWPIKKRFSGDLVQILRLMGKNIERETFVKLRDESGTIHSFKYALKPQPERTASRVILNSAGINEDLDTFQRRLEAQFAYLETNDFDYRGAIQKIREDKQIISRQSLAKALNENVINQFIDGHARVSGIEEGSRGYLPFLIEVSGDRFVALKADRSGLVKEQFPYVKQIDGRSIEQWIAQTKSLYPKGSIQYCRRHALRALRLLQQIRSESGQPLLPVTTITLANENDDDSVEVEMAIADKAPIYGLWPRAKASKILDGNIGYLRITQMNEGAVEDIKTWMPKFKNTNGLIVDVRGNGGGIRTPILELAAFLMSPENEPRIGNVARYRLFAGFDADHLSAARYVYREDDSIFEPREKEAIRKFKATFTPEWKPDEKKFSDWHYLVLSKKPADPRYFYDKHVIMLCDEKCFSATDIFLSAFKGWPNVTLMGQPSGGGSARVQGFELENSGIRVRCASMASFQPNGQLYDTRGVQPDVRITRPPEYFVINGRDVILDAAIQELAQPDSHENTK